MKIETTLVPEMTIEEFADTYGLVMEVHERTRTDLPRFCAHFKDADTKDGCILRGEYGDGPTPEAAIANYASRISLKLLCIDAGRESRKEIPVPRLVPVKKERAGK